ncbi:unnamed protein product [Pelagomonas calceolata]|uniref:Serine hydrolase domain-containing protein n=3 Tax=Pelagomonas calceolata TaxID=35677 RepID=A0A8J2SUT2_9STRA|nr:unnamed protein product [Pelagomonas calceolata]
MRRALTTIALGARYASSLSTSKRKILVLHGKGGSGASMKLRFQAIENALPEFDFTYATAPHELDGGGYQWWTLPPGVRSYQATEYGGVDAALDVVRSSQADVVWGHSQGAILLGFAAATEAIDWLGGAKLILNGASWPKPYEAELERGCRGDTLHVLGATDDINPPEQARRLAACFDNARVHVHPGGHYVPTDEAAIECYRDFLLSGAASDCPLPMSTDAPQVMIERTLNSLAGDDVDAALRRIWDLAGDTFKYYYRFDTLDEFIKDAKQTSDEFATSFYGMAITGKRWTVLRPFTVAGGCVEINQCVGCTGQFFTKSFLGDDAAVLAPSSGEEPASPRHRAGVASMAWRTTRRFSTNAP